MKLYRYLFTIILLFGGFGVAQAKVLVDMGDFKDWRDEASNPGFNANFKIDKKNNTGIITLAQDKKFGKVMSAQEGVSVNIDENTKIYVKLQNDINDGSITINLMTAAEPYDAHKIIAAVDKKGVYSAKIAEKTPWTGKHSFWVEVWLGGENEPVAKISGIKITDGKKTVNTKVIKTRKIIKKAK